MIARHLAGVLPPKRSTPDLLLCAQALCCGQTRWKHGNEATPAAYVALRPFTVLPPVFALWGAQHGYNAPPRMAGSAAPTEIDVTYPENGARYLVDPDTPERFQSIPLQQS